MTDAVKKYRIIGLVIAALIFISDQFAKYMIMFPLDLKAKGQIILLPFFNLTWAENYGVSMGMLTASSDFQRWALVALTGLIACAVLIWMFRETAKWDILALSLVLGGALGNIVDRAMHGYVVDFLDLHIGGFRPFLIFNVADACISIGVVILLARALLLRDKSTEASD